MTRNTQKEREADISRVFISAYIDDYKDIIFKFASDEQVDKFDVSFICNPDEEPINFQVKELPFHPDDKTPRQYADEVSMQQSMLNGNANPRIHVYDSVKSPWQSSFIKTIQDSSKKYTDFEKTKLDLLLLIDDASLASNNSVKLEGLGDFGFRSISLVVYRKQVFSKIIYANDSSPSLFRRFYNVEKICRYAP